MFLMSEKRKFDIMDWLGQQNTRWILHVFFWLAVLVFYTLFFGYKTVDYKITFSFVVVLMPVTMITTYFLNYTLLPNYLFKKRYGKFFLYFIYTLIVSFYIEMVTVMAIFILVAQLNMKELHPSNTNALIIIAGMYLVVFLGAAIKLVNLYNDNQVEIQKLKSDKIEAELKFLKAQLNPHFLFNTLNNLYSLTLERSKKAPEVVMKLSELLDYILYKCDGEEVPLRQEIVQLHNYVELEKLRYGQRLAINLNHENIPNGILIPPMLFMPLLENSFKHGVSRSMEKSWIDINFTFQGNDLRFRVSNTKHMQNDENVRGGIGLENLKNRLELIFKDDYDLIIENLEASFIVTLILKNILKK